MRALGLWGPDDGRAAVQRQARCWPARSGGLTCITPSTISYVCGVSSISTYCMGRGLTSLGAAASASCLRISGGTAGCGATQGTGSEGQGGGSGGWCWWGESIAGCVLPQPPTPNGKSHIPCPALLHLALTFASFPPRQHPPGRATSCAARCTRPAWRTPPPSPPSWPSPARHARPRPNFAAALATEGCR